MAVHLKVKTKQKSDKKTIYIMINVHQMQKSRYQCNGTFFIYGNINEIFYTVFIFLIQSYEIELRVLNSEIPLERYKFEAIQPKKSFKENFFGVYEKSILQIRYRNANFVKSHFIKELLSEI